MAAGIGVDMLEIARMERAMRRRPSILRRLFTDEERAYCDACARPAEHYAARFAAREAVLKALGTGFGQGVGLKDVSVRNDENGRPTAVLSGRAAQLAAARGVQEVALSLSHTREVAVANAVMVTADVRPKVEERRDPAAELLASFKSARTVIDELELLQREALMDAVSPQGDEASGQVEAQRDGLEGDAAQGNDPAQPTTNGV
jgi:holo-[acyl-carrier protein] synthase